MCKFHEVLNNVILKVHCVQSQVERKINSEKIKSNSNFYPKTQIKLFWSSRITYLILFIFPFFFASSVQTRRETPKYCMKKTPFYCIFSSARTGKIKRKQCGLKVISVHSPQESCLTKGCYVINYLKYGSVCFKLVWFHRLNLRSLVLPNSLPPKLLWVQPHIAHHQVVLSSPFSRVAVA